MRRASPNTSISTAGTEIEPLPCEWALRPSGVTSGDVQGLRVVIATKDSLLEARAIDRIPLSASPAVWRRGLVNSGDWLSAESPK